jgi:hypothetical protein
LLFAIAAYTVWKMTALDPNAAPAVVVSAPTLA